MRYARNGHGAVFGSCVVGGGIERDERAAQKRECFHCTVPDKEEKDDADKDTGH